jgi:hypothetical protein
MIYVLGVLTGLLIASLLFLIELYLASKQSKPLETIQSTFEKKLRPKGFILTQVSTSEYAQRKAIEKNDQLGLDTSIEDLI